MPKRKRQSGSKKPSSAPSKRPQRRGKPRTDSPESSTSDPNTSVQRKQVSPLITALILVPLLGVFAYGGYQLIRAGQDLNGPDDTELTGIDPGIDQLNGEDSSKASKETKVEDFVSCKWETEDSLAEKWDRIDDPTGDGWNTEVFNQRVASQFAAIKKQLLKPQKIDSQSLDTLVASDVSVGLLRPSDPDIAWKDDQLQVYRSNGKTEDAGLGGSDRASMAAALKAFASKYSNPAQFRSKIKVFRIEESDGYTDTWQTVELFGKTDRGLEEENIVWRARWRLDDSGRFPLITQLTFEDYEGVVRPGNPLFADCTESIFTGNERFQNQLLIGYNQILQRCQVSDYYLTLGNPGIALGDVNNDGLEDLYVCQENGLPNLLFIQNSDGSLEDATDRSGANWLQNCRTALIVDLDNDGNNDLAVAFAGGVVVAAGDGTGQFQVQRYLSTSADVLVLNSADYDLDGRLDLFAGVYSADGALLEQQQMMAAGAGGEGFVYVDAKDGGRNSLFRNLCANGEWQFEDVTKSTGMDRHNQRFSQAAAWADFDNDGDPDLYVANDYGPNNLYRNDVGPGGKRSFIDIAKQAGAEDFASGMSVDWADFNCDGLQDVYVGNMYSYAGNRIAFQNQFKPNQSTDVVEKFQRFARGNTLMRNRVEGNGENPGDSELTFEDQSLSAAVNRGRWAWGSRFVDLNNDGWQDIIVANGFITADDSGDL